MMDVRTAGRLLDFAQRIGPGQRAEEQLEGAVAIHNILRLHKVAYLADEVGMGKTYVALGALALFRHFDPGFRVLVIAPRRNIQLKWVKEMGNFTRNNVRFADLRVKGIDGEPARARVACENLVGLVRETALNPDRDFFLRLTSFSLPVGGEDAGRSAEAKRLRRELRAEFPWLSPRAFDLRDRQLFKDNVARAICCVLPVFDLVIVDEAHNLKQGFGAHVSSRNRVLSLVFGRPDKERDARRFPNYDVRARRVLFLSATPVEESYRQLWNQLDVFGRGKPFTGLRADDLDEEGKKALAREFLIRRVTEVRVNERSLTKNLYRREWRAGGVAEHDQPIRVQDTRERLVVALVQKKVSELLGSARFGNAFQIGMLASFESFLETARVKPAGAEAAAEDGNFDDSDQTQDQQEREGIDVASLNRLAISHRQKFGRELPHPKMDALVRRLAAAWATGEKSLVFVRRVASVKELKRKLDEHYNEQLLGWMRGELAKVLPPVELERFDRLVKDFHKKRREVLDQGVDELGGAAGADDTDDRGGTDTFFAWFLRGESAHKDGSVRLLDGPLVRKRHSMPQSPFFEDNYAAHVLQCPPGEVLARLAAAAGLDPAAVRAGLRGRARPFLRARKKLPRGDRFLAAQAAAVQWLVELEGPHRERARAVWRERFVHCHVANPIAQAPDLADLVECRTFFTELRNRPALRHRLWPEPATGNPAEAFREQELRARLLSAAARLGHAFVDLYLLTLCRLRTLGAGAGDEADEASGDSASHGIAAFLDLLETQMNTPLAGRRWGAYDELAQLGARDEAGHSNFDLILDTNDPDLRTAPLDEAGRRFGTLLSRQQPAAGMAGKLNQTLVRQFRMPGYPSVLVSTDLLQEGEDLHTFCSSIHHYGISWTPSAMEQRIGRIDRVRSQTERRLAGLRRELRDEEKLQVYFPHLQDTVEVVQVQRVLARMNTFLRLMHEGLTLPGGGERKLDLNRELLGARRVVPQILTPLQSAFGVQPRHLEGGGKTLAVSGEAAAVVQRRFNALPDARFPGLRIDWERSSNPARLLGTVHLGKRVQPFTLLLHSLSGAIVVRCVSPVGQRQQFEDDAELRAAAAQRSVRLGAIATEGDRTYDLTVENDVLFPVDDEAAGVARVAWLIRHVTQEADRLEQEQLPGQDQPLGKFRADLEKERSHEG